MIGFNKDNTKKYKIFYFNVKKYDIIFWESKFYKNAYYVSLALEDGKDVSFRKLILFAQNLGDSFKPLDTIRSGDVEFTLIKSEDYYYAENQ